ncbi:MAG: DUF2304 domain-containing protein [Myxococcales bacterium]|nr:DUF2304 domain-containing protein [Myxococcales bacterium]
MSPTQKVFAIVTSAVTLFYMVELVRRRRLKEEYAWLWILTGAGMLVLSLAYPLLLWLTQAVGAVTPTTTLFIFGLLFLLIISVHYSIVLSRLTGQVRRLTQELAILSAEGQLDPGVRPGSPPAS